MEYKHITLPEEIHSSLDFAPATSRGGENTIPNRDRIQHAEMLNIKFNNAWEISKKQHEERTALSLNAREGSYIEFKSAEGYELMYKSLENINSGIRLLNVRKEETINDKINTYATVYIPSGKENSFLKKLRDYKEKDTNEGKPCNATLINSIEDINIAVLESMWTDNKDLLPTENFDWFEIWIKIDEKLNKEDIKETFFSTLVDLNIEHKNNCLFFPERAVVLVKANKDKLIELLYSSDLLAEFKKGQETAGFICHESNLEQKEWVEDILNRFKLDDKNISVCILDTGVNNGHRLLSELLSNENCLTVDPNWLTSDRKGHGTKMAGVVAYGDMTNIVSNSNHGYIYHTLCSVKILPDNNNNPNPVELWGDITQQAISLAEIKIPDKEKIYCMAVTEDANTNEGVPSSWSGALDTICFGDEKNKRLFIISGGNIRDNNEIWNNYPIGNNRIKIQNPAQSWNALTIGAYTDKIRVSDSRHINFSPLALRGGISPYSTTSILWDKTKPIKPEVTFEGGNLLKINDNLYTSHADLEVLTTSDKILLDQFDTINGTSSATALAANLAAKIAAKYPDLWPESIRGLIVHSAQWTEGMKIQYPMNGTRHNIKDLLRTCGYGVPDEKRALYSKENGFTYISQNEIQPFKKKNSSISCNEMHFFDLPWPKELLESLGEIEVKLKITLSYFIDPSPGEMGWDNKYRYQSCGLRFDINNTNEPEIEFKCRINKKIQEENEDTQTVANDSTRWTIGAQNRNVGSIHSDSITKTAIELASCNLIAIYPIVGWWKLRTNLNKYNKKLRYSLIISLDTPTQDIDIYNVVKTKIETLIPNPIEITIPTNINQL